MRSCRQVNRAVTVLGKSTHEWRGEEENAWDMHGRGSGAAQRAEDGASIFCSEEKV